MAPDGRRLSERWLEETQRDVMALGSWVFYVLVLGRALVGPFWDLVVPLVVIGAGMLIGQRWIKGADLYVARAMVVGVLLTRHYGDIVFGIVAGTFMVLLVVVISRLGRSRRAMGGGLLVGAAASVVGYAIAVEVE